MSLFPHDVNWLGVVALLCSKSRPDLRTARFRGCSGQSGSPLPKTNPGHDEGIVAEYVPWSARASRYCGREPAGRIPDGRMPSKRDVLGQFSRDD
jgi:hypothetical protein